MLIISQLSCLLLITSSCGLRGNIFSCPSHIIENFMTSPSWPKERNDKAEVLAKGEEKKGEVKRFLTFSGIFSLVPRRSIRYRSRDLSNFASTTQPVHTRQQCSYMCAWASQATVPFIQHICRYVQISSNIYKRKNRSTKAGHENPKKPAVGKNTGNVYPRPRQWCNPWGFRVC